MRCGAGGGEWMGWEKTMNLFKCPHCARKLGNYMYSDLCPYCRKELVHNTRPLVPAPPKRPPGLDPWPVRCLRSIARFVES